MDTGNETPRPPQGDESPSEDGEPSIDADEMFTDDDNESPSADGGEPAMDTDNWRSRLQPDTRQRIVNTILETLMRHLPFSGQEGLQELREIAVRFEEKIYTTAPSLSDYLRKISEKMQTVETKSQKTMTNSIQSNSDGSFLTELVPIFLDQSSEVPTLDSTAPARHANGADWQEVYQTDTSSEWTFLMASFVLEILSAACEQLSSRNKPLYALGGMLFAIAALLLCIWELADKVIKDRTELRRREMLRILYYPSPHNTPRFKNVANYYGLAGAVYQLFCATFQWFHVRKGVDNPIKFSTMPLVFLVLLACSRARVRR